MKRLLLAFALLLAVCGVAPRAHAQAFSALTVSACGGQSLPSGQFLPVTMDLTGKICDGASSSGSLPVAATIVNPLGPTTAAASAVATTELQLSGTASVTSATTLFDLSTAGYQSVSVTITSAGTSNTITFDCSDDNTNFGQCSNVYIASQAGTTSTVNAYGSPTVGQRFIIDPKAAYVRARVTTYTSGTFSIAYTLSPEPAGQVQQYVTQANAPWATAEQGSASSTVGVTPGIAGSAASSSVLKASAGNLYGVYATCSAACYLMVFNSTTAPSNGSTTAGTASGNMQDCVSIAAGSTGNVNYNPGPPEAFSVGMTAVISSTGCATLTLSTVGFIHGSVR